MTEELRTITAEELFQTGNVLYTHILNYERNPLHRHEFFEFFYVISGKCTHILNDKSEIVGVNDAYLLCLNDVHTFSSKNTSEFLHRDILFLKDFFKKVCDNYSPDFYEKFLSGKYSVKLHLTNEQINQIETFCSALAFTGSSDPEIIFALCSYIIDLLIAGSAKEQKKYPQWLSRLLATLNAPQNMNMSIAELTSFYAYDHSYMCRMFKRCIGRTMTDYFNEQKMKYACNLLRTSKYSIQKVCETVGFDNLSHFYTCFKKQYGTTPNKIRKLPALEKTEN